MKNLHPKIAYKVGLVLGEKYRNILIGRDTRTTGKMLESSLISGILQSGGNAILSNIVPTPVLGFNAKYYDVGVMITASHNPGEYNGIKIFKKDGISLNKKEEEEIENNINKEFEVNWKIVGKCYNDNQTIKRYKEFILNKVEIEKEHNILVDCGNGAGSLVSPYLLKDVGCNLISINSHIDGRFSRVPEPSEEHLKETMEIAKALNRLCIVHDGDADRVGVIDEKGRFSDFDKLMAIFCKFLVEKYNIKKIVTTVDSSIILDNILKDYNVEIYRTKVGDVYVSEEMIKRNAKFGCEPSGTWIHGDIHLTPDGILSGLRILEMLEFYNSPLYKLLDSVKSYINIREKIYCKNELKDKVMNYIIENGEKVFKTKPEIVDGARFNLDDGWILIRPSGTEEYIRIRVEAKTKELAKSLLDKGIKLVKEAIQTFE